MSKCPNTILLTKNVKKMFNMNIEEIRQARFAAEQQILIVLKAFRERTGLSIVGCDVETYQINSMSGQSEISPAIAVRLKVEPI